MTRPIRVRVSSNQTEASITNAISIMKPRVAGNGEHTKRTTASAVVHMSAGAAPTALTLDGRVIALAPPAASGAASGASMAAPSAGSGKSAAAAFGSKDN